MPTNKVDVQKWLENLDFGSNSKIVEITVPKAALDYFNSVVRTIK